MNVAEIAVTGPACQRWTAGRQSWQHGSRFDPARYRVGLLDEKAAKAFVVEHHYSHAYVAAMHRVGLWRGDQLVGVAVLSVPAQESVLTNVLPDLTPYRESVELGRFVLVDDVEANGESWFLARAFRLARDLGVRGVVSFADPVPRATAAGLLFPGHVGTIYQASNARLCGRSTARTVTLLPDGSTLNDRARAKVRQQERGHDYVERRLVSLGARPLRAGERPAEWLAGALDDVGARSLRHRGCYRYVFPLDRRVRVAVTADRYPKTPDALPAEQGRLV